MDGSYTEKEVTVFENLLELVITCDEKYVLCFLTQQDELIIYLRCVEPREVFEPILSNHLKMTQKEFAETMVRFHRDKWIGSGPRNTVIFLAQVILEMQSFIIDTYRDYLYNCQICRHLLIQGFICSNR